MTMSDVGKLLCYFRHMIVGVCVAAHVPICLCVPAGQSNAATAGEAHSDSKAAPGRQWDTERTRASDGPSHTSASHN